MQTQQLPATDLRGPYRVHFTALGVGWVREFWECTEAEEFARGIRRRGDRARVEGGGLESRRVA